MKLPPSCYQINAVLWTNTRAGSVRGKRHLPQSILLVWTVHPAGSQHFPKTCLPSCQAAAAPFSAAGAPRPVSRLPRRGTQGWAVLGLLEGAWGRLHWWDFRELAGGCLCERMCVAGGWGWGVCAREGVSERNPTDCPSHASAPGPLPHVTTPSRQSLPLAAASAPGRLAMNREAAPGAAPLPATAAHQDQQGLPDPRLPHSPRPAGGKRRRCRTIGHGQRENSAPSAPPPRPEAAHGARRLWTGGLPRLPPSGRQVRAGSPAPAPCPALTWHPGARGSSRRRAAGAARWGPGRGGPRTTTTTLTATGAPQWREPRGHGPSAAGPPAGCC